MTEDTEFRVQYLDSAGVWCNVYGTYTSYTDACYKMMEEAKQDPEYTHRIVRSQVLGFITGEGNINE